MATTDVIICPECGGIVGATETTSQGKPCTCVQVTGGLMPADAAAAQKKVCCKCGKDLSGRKRLRDEVGYWCYDCHKADEKKKHPDGIRCAECGRKVPDAALFEFEGVRICAKCKADNAQIARQKLKYKPGIADAFYKAQERRRVIIIGAITAVLLVIIILSRLHFAHHIF